MTNEDITPFSVSVPGPLVVSTTLAGNNAAIVADALRSVVGWADRCLVLDTGISDSTLEIARAVAGDKLVVQTLPWRDDFAAARNFALQAAANLGAAWAVTLDTDERLDLAGIDIHAFLTATAADVLHVRHAGGTYAKERFFRLPARGTFVGPTHEAFVAAPGTIAEIPDVVFHELAKDAAQYRHKAERDIGMLERHTATHPNDPRWFYYLGDSYAGVERYEEAITAFRRCTALRGWDEESAWAMYRAAECQLQLGRPLDAIESCAQGMARHAGLGELPWLAGYAAWQAGQPLQAIHWSRIAIALGNFSGAGNFVVRRGFCHPPGLWEGPFDVMRFAWQRIGQEDAAAEAEALYKQAKAAREAKASP